MSGDGNRLEEWKKAGECRDFPQPWSDYLWSLEFEHRPDDAKAFHSVAKAVCEQCPVRAECLAYAASGGLEWGVYGGKVCTDRRRIARMAEADGVPCRDRSLPWPQLAAAHGLDPLPPERVRRGHRRGQRRTPATASSRTPDGPTITPHMTTSDNQTIKQAVIQTTRQADNQACMVTGNRKGEERMRIAIANAKGGVAKTTSSIYIASVIVSRGGRAVVYDADPQSSASLWASAAEQTAGPLTFDVLPANQATLRQLAAGSDPDEWAIIDAPPQGPTLDMAIKAADFVIVPASDSPMDLQQAWNTLDMARMSTPAALLLVKAERSTKAFHDTMDALNAMDTPRFDTIVPKAQSYKRSLGTNPHQLGKYRDLVTELQQIAGKQETMQGNYQPLARPVPFDDVLRQQNKTSKTAGEPLVMLSLRIPVSLKTRLKTTAAAHDLPMQQLLRAAIERELDRLGGDDEP